MDTFSTILERDTGMNKMFCTIRKWDYRGNKRYNPSKTNLNKQVHTLHRKLKKKDKVYTSYSIERDKGKQQYHIHTLFYYTDKKNLHEQLQKYIGGEITERKWGFDSTVHGALLMKTKNYNYLLTQKLLIIELLISYKNMKI